MAFGFYTPLTITSNSSLLPATQTNFPLLLSFTDNRFKTVGNGGHVQNSSGFDIRPYSNSSLTTALSYERVSYSASAGTFQIWVLIPSLSQGLVIYLAYGDAALSSDGTSLSAVWSANGYICVYHHEQATGANAPDSSGNSNTATAASGTPTSATGQIQNGISLSGVDWFTTPQSAFGTNGALTWQGWYKLTTTAQGRLLLSKDDSLGTVDFYIRNDSPANALRFSIWNATGTRAEVGIGGVTASSGVWYFLVGSYDGANLNGYVNATANGTQVALTGNVQNTSGASINQGVQLTVGGFNGVMDEVRLANVGRSANWVTCEYNNQLNPTTFVTLGTETTPGAAPFLFWDEMQRPEIVRNVIIPVSNMLPLRRRTQHVIRT